MGDYYFISHAGFILGEVKMNPIKNKAITIIGCGTLGSSLAYMLALKNLNLNFLDELNLVDNDVLTSKNYPYILGYENLHEYEGLSKPLALSIIIEPLFESIEIGCHTDARYIVNLDNTTVIDCRDTANSDIKSDIKLNIDGEFGYVNFNPGIKKIKEHGSKYTYGNMRFYSMLFSGFVVDLLLKEELRNKYSDEIVISFKDGMEGIYGISRQDFVTTRGGKKYKNK